MGSFHDYLLFSAKIIHLFKTSNLNLVVSAFLFSLIEFLQHEKNHYLCSADFTLYYHFLLK